MRVEVLEARDRIGGRIDTHRDARAPAPIELGAEFIHGSAPETMAIVREAGLLAVDIPDRHSELRGRKRTPSRDFWARLEHIMGRMNAGRDPDRSFHEFLATSPGGRRFARDRALARDVRRELPRGRYASHQRARAREGRQPARRSGRAAHRTRARWVRSRAWMARAQAARLRAPAHHREAHRVGARRRARRDHQRQLRGKGRDHYASDRRASGAPRRSRRGEHPSRNLRRTRMHSRSSPPAPSRES